MLCLHTQTRACHTHSHRHTHTHRQLGRTWTSSDSLPLAKPNYTYRRTQADRQNQLHEQLKGVGEACATGRGDRSWGGQTFILLSRSLSLSSPSSSSFAVGVRVRTYACEPFGLTLRPHNSSINFHVLGPQLPLPHIRHGHAPAPIQCLGSEIAIVWRCAPGPKKASYCQNVALCHLSCGPETQAQWWEMRLITGRSQMGKIEN